MVLTLACRAASALGAVFIAARPSLTGDDLGDGRLHLEGYLGEQGASEIAGASGRLRVWNRGTFDHGNIARTHRNGASRRERRHLASIQC